MEIDNVINGKLSLFSTLGKVDNLMGVDNLLISKLSLFSKLGKGDNLMGVDNLVYYLPSPTWVRETT